MPAKSLENVPFPKCAGHCEAIEVLGAGECSVVCPEKFKTFDELRDVPWGECGGFCRTFDFEGMNGCKKHCPDKFNKT